MAEEAGPAMVMRSSARGVSASRSISERPPKMSSRICFTARPSRSAVREWLNSWTRTDPMNKIAPATAAAQALAPSGTMVPAPSDSRPDRSTHTMITVNTTIERSITIGIPAIRPSVSPRLMASSWQGAAPMGWRIRAAPGAALDPPTVGRRRRRREHGRRGCRASPARCRDPMR